MSGRAGQAPRSQTLYRVLLRMLPAEFRGRHGGAMAETFAALHESALRTGHGAVLRLWLRESWDLVRTGLSLRAATYVRARSSARALRSRRGRLPDMLLDDVRLAVRATTRHGGFFVLAVLTLALGIGATTAMYSALKAVVLDPLPFPAAERMVTLWRVFGGTGTRALLALEPGQVEALRDQRDVFDGIEALGGGAGTLTGYGEPERLNLLKVTAGVPALMGVQPILGRVFSAEEMAGNGARVALLSQAFWRSRFGGRPDVLGRTLSIDGDTWTIIGVMPRHAVRPDGNPQPIDLWLPLPESEPFRAPIARLTDETSVEAATARVDAIVRRDSDGRIGGTAQSVRRAGPLHDHLRILMIAVTLLLLVACVNVANLLLQRAAARGMETAVRAALGATRPRLVRQFVFESVILAIAAGVVGAALAYAGLHTLLAFRPEQLEGLRNVRVDGSVLRFCVSVSAAAGLLVGLVPAVHGSRARATAVLGRAGRTAGRSMHFRSTLVAAEVSLSFALLIAAALVITSLRDLTARDPGYRADGLISVDVRLPSWRYTAEPARAAAFERIVVDVRRIPRVASVSLATGVPPRISDGRFGHLQVAGRARETQASMFHSIDADEHFLETLGQPLVAGRGFIPSDAVSDINPVILSESAARRLFPAEPAVGRRFQMEGPPDFTVVGVMRDIRTTGLGDEGTVPLAYWIRERVRTRMTVVIRAHDIDPQLLLDLSQIVLRAEPEAIVEVATVRELLGASVARERFTTTLLSTFAALALMLAAVGLYGVLSQVVLARTREIGVRMALGADAARIRALVLRTGALPVCAGVVCGALLAIAGLRLLRSQVFGLAEHQPPAYIGAAAVLLSVALAAMVIPARRAARLDPVRAIAVH